MKEKEELENDSELYENYLSERFGLVLPRQGPSRAFENDFYPTNRFVEFDFFDWRYNNYDGRHTDPRPTYERERAKYTVRRTPGPGAHLGCPDKTCPCPK